MKTTFNPTKLARLHKVEYIGPQTDASGKVLFHLFNDETRSTFAAKSEPEFFRKLQERRIFS